MDAAVSSARSILNKPLSQLTEDDISQLTREDCRKYLKDKGMRRPSWNKSQAIQQVISLKALLETSEDSGAGALRRILVTKPAVTSISADSPKEPSDSNNLVAVSVDDFSPRRQNDSPKSGPPGPLDSPLEEADNTANGFSGLRNPRVADTLIGQMTIFYCGKVNVYDGVPPDKAQAILHLAATPLQSPSDDQIHRPAFSFPYHLQAQSDKHLLTPFSASISHPAQAEKMTQYSQQCKEKGSLTHDQEKENQLNRKMLVQRYREKKKDRERCKVRKTTGPASSSLEMYLNHHVRTQTHTSNEQSTRNSISPPHPVVPRGSSTAADDQMEFSFAVDLNEDVQDI